MCVWIINSIISFDNIAVFSFIISLIPLFKNQHVSYGHLQNWMGENDLFQISYV